MSGISAIEKAVQEAGTVVLYDGFVHETTVFVNPLQVCQALSLAEVIPALETVEKFTEQGCYAAGFVTYEAAPAFDPALVVHSGRSADLPLVWFGIYRSPEILRSQKIADTDCRLSPDWQPSISERRYRDAITKIREFIASGETYQVNFTLRFRADIEDSGWDLFQRMMTAQRVPYGAFLNLGMDAICSASPELFFRLKGDVIECRPMKGTARRGVRREDDLILREALRTSVKDRAENVMIVDMVRNDLGRIAEPGSVEVPSLFDIETYDTVHQMTSTVTARTQASIPDILKALFPCASITGAPKIRTSQLIADLEDSPRGIYCGAIGVIEPKRHAQFNVAIRTVAIDRQQWRAEYGVGGGIVWDSDPVKEYDEVLAKSAVIVERRPEFRLLETILWKPESGYFLFERHLKRMRESALYFGYGFDPERMSAALSAFALTLRDEPMVVRVLLSQDGTLSIESSPLSERPPIRRVMLAEKPVNMKDPFLYHKTTHRAAYEEARASRPRADDVILWNERGEVTESTMANIVLRVGSDWVTPPVECGLLPGTFREHLLESGELHEGVISVEQLRESNDIRLINSVRGWVAATLY